MKGGEPRGGEKRCIEIYGERPEGKENFGDLALDEDTILIASSRNWMAEHGLDLCVISGFRRKVDENCALPKGWILYP